MDILPGLELLRDIDQLIPMNFKKIFLLQGPLTVNADERPDLVYNKVVQVNSE